MSSYPVEMIDYGKVDLSKATEFAILNGWDSMNPRNWSMFQFQSYAKWIAKNLQDLIGPRPEGTETELTEIKKPPVESLDADAEEARRFAEEEFGSTTRVDLPDASKGTRPDYSVREAGAVEMREIHAPSDYGPKGKFPSGVKPSRRDPTSGRYWEAKLDKASAKIEADIGDIDVTKERAEVPKSKLREVFDTPDERGIEMSELGVPEEKMSELPGGGGDYWEGMMGEAPTGSGGLIGKWNTLRSGTLAVRSAVSKFADKPVEFAVDLLKKTGLSSEVLGDALADAFVGESAVGNPLFSWARLKSEMLGVGAGTAVSLVINEIQKMLPPEDWNINSIMGISGFLISAGEFNPFTTVITGSILLGQAFVQRAQNIADNDYAGDTTDSMTGYIKDSGKWYPAVLKSLTKDEGIITSGENELTWEYGRPEDLFFTYEGDHWSPHFRNYKVREVRAYNSEMLPTERTLEYAEHMDPLRTWAIMTPGETKKILEGYGTRDFDWSIIDAAESDLSIVKQFQQLQMTLDGMQDLKRSASGDPEQYKFSDSKALRRRFMISEVNTNWPWISDPSVVLAEDKYKWGVGTERDDHTRGPLWHRTGIKSVEDYIYHGWTRQLKFLDGARGKAAESVGISETGVYNDYAKDLDVAESWDALVSQWSTIDGYADRNATQKTYLKAKAGVRYQMKWVSQMGYSNYLTDMLHEPLEYGAKSDIEHDYATKLSILPRSFDMDVDRETGTHWVDEYNYNSLGVVDYKQALKEAKYAGFMRSVPSWLNRGEAAIPEWMDDLVDGRREKEDLSIPLIEAYITKKTAEIGYTPDELIARAVPPPETPSHTGIPWTKKINKQESFEEDYRKRMAEKRARRLKHKHDMKQVLQDHWDYMHKLHKTGHTMSMNPIMFAGETELHRFNSDGVAITYPELVHRIKTDEYFDLVHSLGVKSYPDFVFQYIKGAYAWQPNRTIGPDLVPPDMFKGKIRKEWEALLEHMEADPDRKYLDYIHDEYNKAETSEYVNKYHPDVSALAMDPEGDIELRDDWSLPYTVSQHRVSFNHNIHTQMDFGVEEHESKGIATRDLHLVSPAVTKTAPMPSAPAPMPSAPSAPAPIFSSSWDVGTSSGFAPVDISSYTEPKEA